MSLALAVTLMTLDHRFDQLDKMRAALAALLSPIQYVVHLPFAGARWTGDVFSTRRALLETNRQLHDSQLELQARLLKYNALETENIRLRQLLDASAKITDEVIVAEILRVEVDPLKRQIIVNKGSRDDAFIGQTVIDAFGIVGQIIHVSPYTATVMLITDPDHAIPVQIVRNGIRSIAVGSQRDYRLELPYLAGNADIQDGDELITSGLGGRFPYGYPVATVRREEHAGDTPVSDVYAHPTAKLDRHREVLLVRPTEMQLRETGRTASPP